MGRPKHGANSARTKCSAKYKSEGRREENKLAKQKRLAEGKKIKSKKINPKPEELRFDTAIRTMFSTYDPAAEKKPENKDRVILKPKNVNKTCVR